MNKSLKGIIQNLIVESFSKLHLGLCHGVLLTLLISACGAGNDAFVGAWVDGSSKGGLLVIVQNGEGYDVTSSLHTEHGILQENMIRLRSGMEIRYDFVSSRLLVNGLPYERLDPKSFLGHWTNANGTAFMEVKSKGENFELIWKHWSDMYQERHVEMIYQNGKLTDSAGIGLASARYINGNYLEITIDNNPEFEPMHETMTRTNAEGPEQGTAPQTIDKTIGRGVAVKSGASDECNTDGVLGFITGNSVRVRSSPDSRSTTNILFRVNKGDEFWMKDIQNNHLGESWTKACFDGKIGWVSSDFTQLTGG